MGLVAIVRGWLRRAVVPGPDPQGGGGAVLGVDGVTCVAPSDAPRPRTGTMTVEPMGCSARRYGC